MSGLDVAQVRAEIAQLRPETAPQAAASPHRPAGARGATEAALSVLKAALASERQRTTELRAEIDALRVTLAASEDRIEALRDARDLWAGRAGLLARAMAQEADGVRDSIEAEADGPSPSAKRESRAA